MRAALRVACCLAASLCFLTLVGCSSGGGSSASSGASASTGGSSGGGSTSSSGSGSSGSGGTGGSSTPSVSIPAPAPASVGTSPKPAQLATDIRVNFVDPNGLPRSTIVFPLTETALTLTPGSVAVTGTLNAAGGTLTYDPSCTCVYLTVVPPGLVTDQNLNSTASQGVGPLVPTSQIISQTWGFVVPGVWLKGVPNSNQIVAAFVTGLQTAPAGMPTGGTGTYSGPSNVIGLVMTPTATANLTGNAVLTVNYGSGAITGTLTNMNATDSNGAVSAWNSVAVSANVAAGTSTFSGTTAVTSSPGASSFALNGTATGSINGGFYGPVTNEIGAVFTLSDGSTDAIGAFGGRSNGQLPIGVPAPGNFGTSPVAPVLASTGGPTLDFSNGSYPFFTTFPAMQTSLQLTTGSGLTAPFGTTTASATFQLDGINCPSLSSCFTSYILTVPSLNLLNPGSVHSTISVPGDMQSFGGSTFDTQTFGLSYTGFGSWSTTQHPLETVTNLGRFVYGYQTQTGSVPTSGTANYAGTGTVQGTALIPSGGSFAQANVAGDAALTVNFGSGSVSGNLTNLKATDSTGAATWNNVSVSATIAGNGFSGTAAATSAPGTKYALGSGASGTFNGGFYGPAVNEVGAIWTLNDGTRSAIGVVGATKQ